MSDSITWVGMDGHKERIHAVAVSGAGLRTDHCHAVKPARISMITVAIAAPRPRAPDRCASPSDVHACGRSGDQVRSRYGRMWKRGACAGCQLQLLDLDGVHLDHGADVSEFAEFPASARDDRRRHGIGTELGAGMERAGAHLRMMIERIPALAWSCRPDGSIEFLNRQWIDRGHAARGHSCRATDDQRYL